MKWVAIVLNVLALVMVGYTLITKGAPNKDALPLVIAISAAPIASLIALVRLGGESWVGLYFKRKALEEKEKIKRLDDR